MSESHTSELLAKATLSPLSTNHYSDNKLADEPLQLPSDLESECATVHPTDKLSSEQGNKKPVVNSDNSKYNDGNEYVCYNETNISNELDCNTIDGGIGEDGCSTNIENTSCKRKLGHLEEEENNSDEDSIKDTNNNASDSNNTANSNIYTNIGSNMKSVACNINNETEIRNDNDREPNQVYNYSDSSIYYLNDDSLKNSSLLPVPADQIVTPFEAVTRNSINEISLTNSIDTIKENQEILSSSTFEKEPQNISTGLDVPSSYYFIDRTLDEGTSSSQTSSSHSSAHHQHHQPQSNHSHHKSSHGDTSRSHRNASTTSHSRTSSTRDPDEGKIFVGGLSWDTTDESLKTYFSKYGRLTDSIVMKTPEGKTRGFAFVTFEDPNVVDIIISQTHYVDGKRVDPKSAIPRDAQYKSEKMFIGGLPWGTTEEDLKGYFSAYGTVLSATLMVDQESNQSRGFGFVTFQTSNDLQNALTCQPHTIKGQSVETTRALPKTKYAEGISSSVSSGNNNSPPSKRQHTSTSHSSGRSSHSNTYSSTQSQGSYNSGNSGRYSNTPSNPIGSSQQFPHSQQQMYPQTAQTPQLTHHNSPYAQMMSQPQAYQNVPYSQQPTSQYPSFSPSQQVSARPRASQPQGVACNTNNNGYIVYPPSSGAQHPMYPYQTQAQPTNYAPTQTSVNQPSQGYSPVGQSNFYNSPSHQISSSTQMGHYSVGGAQINPQGVPANVSSVTQMSPQQPSASSYYQPQRQGGPFPNTSTPGGYYGVLPNNSGAGQPTSQGIPQQQHSYYGIPSSVPSSSYYSAIPSTYQPSSGPITSAPSQSIPGGPGQSLPSSSPNGPYRTSVPGQSPQNVPNMSAPLSSKPNISSYYSR